MTFNQVTRFAFAAAAAFVSLLITSIPSTAQHLVVGSTVDAVASTNTGSSYGVPQSSGNRLASYSAFPALQLTSRGAESSFNLGYAFGWNRYASNPAVDFTSHSANLGFQKQFSSKTSLNLTNSFTSSTDTRTFFALRGVEPGLDPSTILLYFEPVNLNQRTRTDYLALGFNRQMSSRNSISFSSNYSFRDYRNKIAGLSDQHDVDVTANFTRQTNEHTSWNVGYTMAYYSFDQFRNSLSHGVRVGYTRALAKDMSFNMAFGATHISQQGTSQFSAGYEGATSLHKTIKGNAFNFTVSQDYGRPTGLATVSKTRRATASVNRDLGRNVNVFADVSAFDGKGVLDNVFSTRGMSSTGNVGYRINPKLSLQGGVEYQRYTKPAPYAFSQTRLFVSLRYTEPTLLHSH